MKRNALTLPAFIISMCILTVIYFLFTLPSENIKWVKIYPDGNRSDGEMIYTGEGSGYNNQPDEGPGLTIYRYSSEISLQYTDKSKRQLTIAIPRNHENMQLSAHYADDKYIANIEIFNSVVNIWETIDNRHISISFNRESNSVEKNIHYIGEKTALQGVITELTPDNGWLFRVYKDSKIVFSRENLTIDEVNYFRKKFSQPSDKDYSRYAHGQILSFQKMIAGEMNIPLIFDRNFHAVDREYFSLSESLMRSLRFHDRNGYVH